MHTKETSGAERIVQNGVVMLRERIEVLTKGAAEEFGLPEVALMWVERIDEQDDANAPLAG